jgi:hypothetical protein
LRSQHPASGNKSIHSRGRIITAAPQIRGVPK